MAVIKNIFLKFNYYCIDFSIDFKMYIIIYTLESQYDFFKHINFHY